jgi:hypothetical protein
VRLYLKKDESPLFFIVIEKPENTKARVRKGRDPSKTKKQSQQTTIPKGVLSMSKFAHRRQTPVVMLVMVFLLSSSLNRSRRVHFMY